jgi:AbrB family looped-hinge helix DNA binding protein
MSRVTSKLQVTIPKAVADRYGITPGAEIEFEPAGDVIRVVPERRPVRNPRERVRLFERALARQREREAGRAVAEVQERGWTREDLYDRGRAR